MIQEQNQNNGIELDEIQFDDYVQKAKNAKAQSNQNTVGLGLKAKQENNNQQQVAHTSPNLVAALCVGLCYLIIKITLATGSSIAFGVLFYIFQRDGEHNDYCENETLKKWAYSISILFFINCGLYFLECIDQIFLKKEYEKNGPFFILIGLLETLVAIGLFTCLIGLQINNTSDCGSLYKVTLAYCIITYVGFGILGLTLLILCLIDPLVAEGNNLKYIPTSNDPPRLRGISQSPLYVYHSISFPTIIYKFDNLIK
ncbi:hypothetical protein ABPG72_006558 [Tetrahymena utriculariae]